MMTFSTPSTLAASSATDLTLLPATNPWMEPPSFFAAVMALRDPWFSWPSLCSRIANVDSNLWRAAGLIENAEVPAALVGFRACESTVLRAIENILLMCNWRARVVQRKMQRR